MWAFLPPPRSGPQSENMARSVVLGRNAGNVRDVGHVYALWRRQYCRRRDKEAISGVG
jgi:hypothetical protein